MGRVRLMEPKTSPALPSRQLVARFVANKLETGMGLPAW
jgi:hypothetical protein